MKITIPHDWCAPDEETGQLPSVQVGVTTNNWLEIVNYWNSLGYFMKSGNANNLFLEFPPSPWIQEKNSFMQVAWWESLCDPAVTPNGDVEGWQAVWQVHPTVYDQGDVPLPIPNSTYLNEEDVLLSRLWKQWGSPNHSHYYLPAASVQAGLTEDRYFIPTWSWGQNILGSEMMYGQSESGVNIVSRQDWQQALNSEALQIVEITPTE